MFTQSPAMLRVKEWDASKSFEIKRSSSYSEVSPTSNSAEGMKRTKSISTISAHERKGSDRFESRGALVKSYSKKGQSERWYELLNEKLRFNNDRQWAKEYSELVYKSKFERLILKLACELCVAGPIECNSKNDDIENEEYARFDPKRIFALFSVAEELMEISDRKNFVEYVCKKGNVELLEMICQKEVKDVKGRVRPDRQHPWKGNFSGYTRLIDLLLYAMNNRCSSEVVLCIAKKVYGNLHNVYCGGQYLNPSRVKSLETRLNQPTFVVEECLKKAIKFGYKDALFVMLAGNVWECIELMDDKVFEESAVFRDCHKMVEETVVDVISSWGENEEAKQRLKDVALECLLHEEIRTDANEMLEKDLFDGEREYIGKKIGQEILLEGAELTRMREKIEQTDDVFDIFNHFVRINKEITKEERKIIVEHICKTGKTEVLEMICEQEMRDSRGAIHLDRQYPWKGNFSGYTKLIDLLQHAIDNSCSTEVVLCIAEKLYGTLHNVYNGRQYIEYSQVQSMQTRLNHPCSIMENNLKNSIKGGYRSAVLVMLGGDIYYSIRLMKDKMFYENTAFCEAYHTVIEAVVNVMSSWVENEERKQYLKYDVQRLLNHGIKMDVKKISKTDLMDELENQGVKIVGKEQTSKEEIIKMLEEKVGRNEVGKLRLKKTVLGTLIFAFLKYRAVAVNSKEQAFTFKLGQREEIMKQKVCDEINVKVNNGESIEGILSKLVQLLNKSTHINNSWYFKEVLAKIVNENLDKLQAVCTALCREPMQKLLNGVKVHKNVDVLEFFDLQIDYLEIETELAK